jgi:hypothetical protein
MLIPKSSRAPTSVARNSIPGSDHMGFMVDKVTLRRAFSYDFCSPCQFAFHQLLHIHLSSYHWHCTILIPTLQNKNLQRDLIPNQFNPPIILTTHLPKIHLNFNIQSSRSSKLVFSPWNFGTHYSSTILGTRWRWVVSFTLQTLYPRGNSPRYPLDRRMGGHQSRSGSCGKKETLALPGNEPPPSSVAQSLYRLPYPGSYYYSVASCCAVYSKLALILTYLRLSYFALLPTGDEHKLRRSSLFNILNRPVTSYFLA